MRPDLGDEHRREKSGVNGSPRRGKRRVSDPFSLQLLALRGQLDSPWSGSAKCPFHTGIRCGPASISIPTVWKPDTLPVVLPTGGAAHVGSWGRSTWSRRGAAVPPPGTGRSVRPARFSLDSSGPWGAPPPARGRGMSKRTQLRP